MRSKNGETLPVDIIRALAKHKFILTVFENMRPSCQEAHIQPVIHAKTLQTRKSRIHSMLNKIVRYGRRHNMIPA